MLVNDNNKIKYSVNFPILNDIKELLTQSLILFNRIFNIINNNYITYQYVYLLNIGFKKILLYDIYII